MPALCRRLNARNIELYDHTRGENVGVRLVSGQVSFLPWLGFIDVETARAIKTAVPVKLVVSRYSNCIGEFASEWVDLKSGEFVQGCLTAEGVYGITSTSVRVLSASTS